MQKPPLNPRADAVQAMRDHLCKVAIQGTAEDILLTVRLVRHTYLPRPPTPAQRAEIRLAAVQELESALEFGETRRHQVNRALEVLRQHDAKRSASY